MEPFSPGPVSFRPGLSEEISVSNPKLVAAPGRQEGPVVTGVGDGAFIMWKDFRQPLDEKDGIVMGSFFDKDGVVSHPTGLPISEPDKWFGRYDAAALGETVLVTWSEQESWEASSPSSVIAVRLDERGRMVGERTVLATEASEPAVAAGGDAFLVLWRSGQRIVGKRIAPDGRSLDPTPISIGSFTEEGVWGLDVAWNGSEWLAVWEMYESHDDRLVAARISAEGVVGDAPPLTISAGHSDSGAVVARLGDEFLVAWLRTRDDEASKDLIAARVESDGATLRTELFPVQEEIYGGLSATTTRKGDVLLVWENRIGMLIAPDGSLTRLGQLACCQRGGESPAVAAVGAGIVLAWGDPRGQDRDEGEPAYNIFAARLASDFSSRDGEGTRISAAAEEQFNPAIAWNGESFFVAWSELWSDDRWYLLGARIAPGGWLLDEEPIVIARVHRYTRPAIAAANGVFLVVWGGKVNGDYGLVGRRVAHTGALLDSEPFDVVRAENYQGSTAIASNGREFLVAWQDDRDGDRRLYARRVNPSGAILDGTGLLIATDSEYESPVEYASLVVASDGRDFLIGYMVMEEIDDIDDDAAGWVQIRSRIVRADGHLAEAHTLPGGDSPNTQSVAGSPDGYLLCCAHNRGDRDGSYRGIRVNTDGTPAGETLFIAASDERPEELRLGWDGSRFVAIYVADLRIHARAIDPDGTEGQTVLVGNRWTWNEQPIASAAGAVAIAYERVALEEPYGSRRVFVRIIGNE